MDLVGHYLDKYAAEDLSKVLIENRTVTSLDLGHNLIGDEGTHQPCSLRNEQPEVTRAGLMRCRSGASGKDVGQEQDYPGLYLPNNSITKRGARRMVNCLYNNVWLLELDLFEEVPSYPTPKYLPYLLTFIISLYQSGDSNGLTRPGKREIGSHSRRMPRRNKTAFGV